MQTDRYMRRGGVERLSCAVWGGAGQPVPSNTLLVGSVPHDWLFAHCAAVVHHGGAGTVAAGLLAGCPTTVVPFFGDQPFWWGLLGPLDFLSGPLWNPR
jgi:UDP-glucoronosyl and UDP-glucosyl transferase